MSNYNILLVSILCLTLCMSGLMQAACLPARLPAEGDMEERSRSRSFASQSECNPVSAAELSVLKNRADNHIEAILRNMTQAKEILDMQLNGSGNSLPTGFYGGKEGNDHTQIAVGVPYFCCVVPHVLDVMKQEAVNEMLGVSSYFHAVYDILDPADNSNLPMTLKKIVTGAEINSCQVPDESICQSFSIQNYSAAVFASIIAQNLRNLCEDILFSLDNVIG